MKYRLICLAVVAAILAGGFVLQGDRSATKRYHQHLEERPYTPCSDHGDEVFCTHLPLFNIVTDVPIPEPFFQDEEGYHLMDENGNRIINNEMVKMLNTTEEKLYELAMKNTKEMFGVSIKPIEEVIFGDKVKH